MLSRVKGGSGVLWKSGTDVVVSKSGKKLERAVLGRPPGALEFCRHSAVSMGGGVRRPWWVGSALGAWSPGWLPRRFQRTSGQHSVEAEKETLSCSPLPPHTLLRGLLPPNCDLQEFWKKRAS